MIENIRFVDIMNPHITNQGSAIYFPLYHALHAMLEFAKMYHKTHEETAINLTYEYYEQFKGMMFLLESIGMVSTTDMFRITRVAHKTMIKIAYN